MNHVERFRAVMNFQPVDRLPRWEWATWWDQTIARWHSEGLPSALADPFSIGQHFELDPYKQFWWGAMDRGHEAAQRLARQVGNHDDYNALGPALFPTPNVGSMAEWRDRQAQGDAVVWITLEGFFWFPRELMGFERLFLAYYDQPDLIHRINGELLDYNLQVLEAVGRQCVPTFMTLAEDMSYNHGPMISQAIFDEFMAPCYRALLERAHEMGLVTIVDTDGDVTLMVPWLIEAGVDGVLPLERQAGVDGETLRDAFPRLRMIGHFDKMTMPRGEEAMRAEFERLLPLMRSGGYIPGVDHQTPPGVSLEQYRIYRRLLDEYTARACH
ncbi:MAG: hypothetical protein GX134_02175 [candidate division WS1 bacterium]|nr:hypothetical protein [candidate division WS1 bacterium]